ncbi:DUF1800 domain-containing protein [Sphingomonas donggukensis]|uniref:DUF1800 domain-containing protein n=1 Tax=Sphingomonas donggukensis TaxID=2949093 RepID=A0ABY4TX34_9SPHN|nr:DUF1800 domain-containing protein [Sphingomonas donggukensis]URW76908.1 DUF1800 domain-containing protein [Sphingomonas donggukensis]
MTDASIALNRFGLGARPDDAPPGDARRWLVDQFDRYEPRVSGAPTAAAAAQALADYQQARQAVRAEQGGARPGQRRRAAMAEQAPAMEEGAAMAPTNRRPAGPRQVAGEDAQPMSDTERAAVAMRRQGREFYTQSVGLRMNAALATPTPFVERLVHFWANHFAVSADGMRVVGLAGPFEFEAIRPHVLGRFRDMLFAVERHPAMLMYLDQAQSVGPNSPLAQVAAARAARGQGQGRKPGLNENLAREIMELHTLGVRTGYSQGDVTEFARAMTGWTVAGLGRGGGRMAGTDGRPGDFVFAPRLHEPGARTIMGRGFAQDGQAQAAAVLDMLAAHPATARHIATKLVRHFVADDPPAAAVARVEAAFLQSGGDLPTIYRALIASPEAWATQPAKFKTPWEWSVSTLRALGLREFGTPQTVGLLQQLGQPTWRPGSPAGWDDTAPSWAGPDAIMRRVEAAERFATRANQQIDPRARAAQLFPGSASAATTQAIARAESPSQGLALLLVSPDFMRR